MMDGYCYEKCMKSQISNIKNTKFLCVARLNFYMGARYFFLKFSSLRRQTAINYISIVLPIILIQNTVYLPVKRSIISVHHGLQQQKLQYIITIFTLYKMQFIQCSSARSAHTSVRGSQLPPPRPSPVYNNYVYSI